MRLIYLWTTRLILTISLAGILPVTNQSAIVQAQSKKKNPAQASKYAKRANAKAKKKDYRGPLLLRNKVAVKSPQRELQENLQKNKLLKLQLIVNAGIQKQRKKIMQER